MWLASGAVGVVATGKLLRARYGSRARAWARVEREPTLAIGGAPPDAFVRITGTLRLVGPPLVAPLSGRACAGYHAQIDEDSVRARVLGAETSFSDFVIDDGSGSALVSMESPQVDVTMDHVWRANLLDAETRFDVERFLASTVDSSKLTAAAKARLVYREGALTQGERVTVFGRFTPGRSSRLDRPYRETESLPIVTGPTLVSDRLHLL